MAVRLRRRQDDHRAPRSSDAPLRDHRDRKRLLALQESVLKATDPPAARSPRWAHRLDVYVKPTRGPPPAAWWARRPARGPLLWTTCTTSAVHPQRGQHCTPIGGQCSTPIDSPRDAFAAEPEFVPSMHTHLGEGLWKSLMQYPGPRIASLPLDPILAIDYCIAQNDGSLWKRLRNVPEYFTVIEGSQERLWKPFLNGLSVRATRRRWLGPLIIV